MEPISTPVFATPFYRAKAGLKDELSRLVEFFCAREKDEFRHKDSPQTAHKALFESSFDLFSWNDPEVQTLKQALYSHLMRFLAETSGFDQQTLGTLRFKNESWYHITHAGGYFQPHNHPLASWSMIYCVDPGDKEVDDERESGCVYFSDPRQGASMFLDPANRHMNRTYSFDAVRFRPEADNVIIFPSYLHHMVEPYKGDRPRITVAANFWFHER